VENGRVELLRLKVEKRRGEKTRHGRTEQKREGQ
jgi:hypothetical protein